MSNITGHRLMLKKAKTSPNIKFSDQHIKKIYLTKRVSIKRRQAIGTLYTDHSKGFSVYYMS